MDVHVGRLGVVVVPVAAQVGAKLVGDLRGKREKIFLYFQVLNFCVNGHLTKKLGG